MMNEYNTKQFTNAPGTGLDASGNLLPGYRYMTYSNGVGMGTPQRIGDIGNLGQTVTANTPPAAGTYNPNITAGPQQQAAPSWANASPQPQQFAQTMKLQTGWGNQGSPFGMQFPYSQYGQQYQQNPAQYQNQFQQSPYGQAFNTQGSPFNRSNQGGLLSGGSFAFGNGGLLNY